MGYCGKKYRSLKSTVTKLHCWIAHSATCSEEKNKNKSKEKRNLTHITRVPVSTVRASAEMIRNIQFRFRDTHVFVFFRIEVAHSVSFLSVNLYFWSRKPSVLRHIDAAQPIKRHERVSNQYDVFKLDTHRPPSKSRGCLSYSIIGRAVVRVTWSTRKRQCP